MVSKAREDLPDPERPVMTVRELRGISTLIFLRLCWRAPRTTSFVRPMIPKRFLRRNCLWRRQVRHAQRVPAHSGYTEARITFDNNRGASPWSNFERSAAWTTEIRAYREHCKGRKPRVNFGGGWQLFTWI